MFNFDSILYYETIWIRLEREHTPCILFDNILPEDTNPKQTSIRRQTVNVVVFPIT